jgi:TRAP-type C4-dicarboxylate transport system permease small subunit
VNFAGLVDTLVNPASTLGASACLATILLLHFLRDQRGARNVNAWYVIEVWSALFLVIAMLIACGGQVVVRYLFSDYVTLTWTEELARVLLVWAAFWGAAMLQRKDEHMRITLVLDALPPRIKSALITVGDAASLLVLAVVAWFSWTSSWKLRIISTVSLEVPLSIFTLAVAVASSIMIVHTLLNVARRVRNHPSSPNM